MHRNPNSAGRKNVLCISCARNKHKQCDLHMNDGAFDAEDFISVSCDCFCGGRIGTQFDSLMAMAQHYAEQVQEFAEETRQAKMLAARAAGVADEVMEIVRAFDSRARDDEGNLMASSRREHVDRVLDEFFLQMKAVASKSEAVLALIAEDSGFGFTQKKLIDKMMELSAPEDDDDTDGFDGPIGDGPQGPAMTTRDPGPDEIEMMQQHERAQAVIAQQRAASAAEDAGWPID
jgi:hypothetical protein